MKLTIYTQNCSWWPVTNRKKYFYQIRDFIEKAEPDIVFLQEIFSKKWATWFCLNQYNLVCQPKRFMVHGGVVILVKKPLQIEFKQAVNFKAQFAHRPLQFLSSLASRRGFLHAYLPDFELNLINTHLTAGFTKKHRFSLVRFLQTNQLLEYVKPLGPTIFGGDLNFRENNLEHNLIKLTCQDISQNIGHTFPAEDAKYDYLFASSLPNLVVNSYLVPWYERLKSRLFKHQPIDHFGVLSQIDFFNQTTNQNLKKS